MRALLLCLVGLMTASPDLAFAEMKLSTKAAPNANEARYFTSIDGLMDGNADVILKETRQGKTVTAAVLDVCYPAEKGSDRKDRFVANLAVNGQTLTGTTQSIVDKLPVTVKLVAQADRRHLRIQGPDQRRPDRDRSRPRPTIPISARRNSRTTRPAMTASRRRRRISPRFRRKSIGVRVKLDAALDFLKSLKGQDARGFA